MPIVLAKRGPHKRVAGYHGTTASAATIIQRDGFKLSENSWDWLGKGVYFFEAAPSMAWQWAVEFAERQRKKGNDSTPALLSAVLDIERCMDLLDDVWDEPMKAAADELEKDGVLAQQHGLRLRSAKLSRAVIVSDYEMPLKAYRNNSADCQVVNAVWGKAKDAGFLASGIRAPFVLGKQLYSNSFFFDEGHVQISVVDRNIISEVTRLV